MTETLARATALLERLEAATGRQERRLEDVDSVLKGIHERLGALYPALDRLYRRAGVGRGRRSRLERDHQDAA